MRALRTLAALALVGSLAGCWVPGGHVNDPPVFDEATHGDSDFDFPSTFPNPSTLVGTLGPNDSGDYYGSSGPAGGVVRASCTLTSGSAFVEFILGTGPETLHEECNGETLVLPLTDGDFGIILSNDSQPVTYRVVVRAS